jgi:hypothetical protein
MHDAKYVLPVALIDTFGAEFFIMTAFSTDKLPLQMQ